MKKLIMPVAVLVALAVIIVSLGLKPAPSVPTVAFWNNVLMGSTNPSSTVGDPRFSQNSVTIPFSLGSESTGIGRGLRYIDIPQFEPGWGTLQSVEVTLDLDVSDWWSRFEYFSPTASGTGNVALNWNYYDRQAWPTGSDVGEDGDSYYFAGAVIRGQEMNGRIAYPHVIYLEDGNGNPPCPPWDGVLDYSGTSGETHQYDAVQDELWPGDYDYDDSIVHPAVSGTGDFTLTIFAWNWFSMTYEDFGARYLNSDAHAILSGTVIYHR